MLATTFAEISSRERPPFYITIFFQIACQLLITFFLIMYIMQSNCSRFLGGGGGGGGKTPLDLASYRRLMHEAVRYNEPSKAIRLLDEMLEIGLSPGM